MVFGDSLGLSMDPRDLGVPMILSLHPNLFWVIQWDNPYISEGVLSHPKGLLMVQRVLCGFMGLTMGPIVLSDPIGVTMTPRMF